MPVIIIYSDFLRQTASATSIYDIITAKTRAVTLTKKQYSTMSMMQAVVYATTNPCKQRLRLSWSLKHHYIMNLIMVQLKTGDWGSSSSQSQSRVEEVGHNNTWLQQTSFTQTCHLHCKLAVAKNIIKLGGKKIHSWVKITTKFRNFNNTLIVKICEHILKNFSKSLFIVKIWSHLSLYREWMVFKLTTVVASFAGDRHVQHVMC